MTLDVFTFIVGDGAEYAEYLKYIAERVMSGKHKINWKCVESLNVSRLPEGFECVGKSGGEDSDHSAMKHALAIEFALEHIEAEYVLLVDMDVAIVYKGWDEVIIQKLNEYDCFGGGYVKSKKCKFSKTRYNDFPTANLFSFRADILRKVKLNFKPFSGDLFTGEVSEQTSKIFKMKEGSIISYDIGWKLPIIFYNNKLTSYSMPCYYQEHNNSQLPYLDEDHEKFCKRKRRTMEEWHYKGKIFATHKKGSRYKSHHLNEKLGLAWKDRVDLYLKGDQNEEKKTNAICKE